MSCQSNPRLVVGGLCLTTDGHKTGGAAQRLSPAGCEDGSVVAIQAECQHHQGRGAGRSAMVRHRVCDAGIRPRADVRACWALSRTGRACYRRRGCRRNRDLGAAGHEVQHREEDLSQVQRVKRGLPRRELLQVRGLRVLCRPARNVMARNSGSPVSHTPILPYPHTLTP